MTGTVVLIGKFKFRQIFWPKKGLESGIPAEFCRISQPSGQRFGLIKKKCNNQIEDGVWDGGDFRGEMHMQRSL
jgi:hypothetical protein